MYRALEFYSGIGGMHYACLAANNRLSQPISVIQAFEISHICNAVYQHNFHHQAKQVGIQGLSVDDLLSYNADIWLLSPPCQPYTRAGKQLDMKDERSQSFLHLCHLLRQILSSSKTSSLAPSFLLLENVQSFERSKSCSHLIEILTEYEYHIQEMILSPIQIQIPNQRSRFFLLARRFPSFPNNNNIHTAIQPSETRIILHYIPNNPYFLTHNYHLIQPSSTGFIEEDSSSSCIRLCGDLTCHPISNYLDQQGENKKDQSQEYEVTPEILTKGTSYCYGINKT